MSPLEEALHEHQSGPSGEDEPRASITYRTGAVDVQRERRQVYRVVHAKARDELILDRLRAVRIAAKEASWAATIRGP